MKKEPAIEGKALVTSVSDVCLVPHFIWPNGVRYDGTVEAWSSVCVRFLGLNQSSHLETRANS